MHVWSAGGTDVRPTPIIAFGDASEQSRISTTHAVASIIEVRADHRFGKRIRVDFEAAERPEIRVQTQDQIDWSAMGQLIVPVRNPGADAVSLVVQVDAIGTDGGNESRSGIVRVRPREKVMLVLPLQDNDPAAMGMRMGPPPVAPRLYGFVRVIGSAQGEINLHHVTGVRLALPYLDSNHTLIFGEPSVISGAKPSPTLYVRIADQFGQYTRTTWPEKIHSNTEMREEQWREERLLKKRMFALPPRDRFGGLLHGPAFEATGFFRTARTDGRWRLVTPEGHQFFSLGINALSPEAGATYVSGREFMFVGLPLDNDPLATHFGNAKSDEGPGFHQGTTFNFYSANLERKFGPDYLTAWRQTAIGRLRAWGFNTIGNWSDPQLTENGVMPYVLQIYLWGDYAQIGDGSQAHSNMPDVFDPKFDPAVDLMIAKAVSAHKRDPYLIGYFVDNELPWGIGESTDPRLRYALAVNTLRLGAASPAKQSFVRLLAEKYGRAEALGLAWGIDITSWDALRADRLTLPDSVLAKAALGGDLSVFTALYADTYFRAVATAIHHQDPNHLYLGSRFQSRTPEAVKACARYCDIVSFNIYAREISGPEWVHFHDLDKPAIIGEFQFGTADRGLFWAGLYNVASEDQRGPAYARYLRSAIANPDIVGCHWFQYVDEPLTGRLLDGENGHIGFVTAADMTYSGFVSAVRQVNLSLLRNGWR
jgi:hypothetical protein